MFHREKIMGKKMEIIISFFFSCLKNKNISTCFFSAIESVATKSAMKSVLL